MKDSKEKFSQSITVSEYDLSILKECKHICVNGVRRLIKVKCIGEISKEYVIATVTQVGGIFTKSAALRVI